MATSKTTGGNAAFHNFNNDFAHIQDPNERRRLALAEIDKAPFGWYVILRVLCCVKVGRLVNTRRYMNELHPQPTQMGGDRGRHSYIWQDLSTTIFGHDLQDVVFDIS